MGKYYHLFTDKFLFHSQINNLFVGFALPCYLHCLRLTFAILLIWKWNYTAAVNFALSKSFTCCGFARPLVARIT